jgi:nucleotide-binding universal stress UspA family protein
MRILLAVDASLCSDCAVEDVCHHAWPPDTEIEVVSVAHTRVPRILEPTWFLMAFHEEALEQARHEAAACLEHARARLAATVPEAHLTATLLEGTPSKEIVGDARRWHADLIVVGSHGRSLPGRLLHGSVSTAVARQAPCQVDVVSAAH